MDSWLTIVLALVSSGVVSTLVTRWFDRGKARAEAATLEEQAEEADIRGLRQIIQTWQEQYGGLVQRLDAAQLQLREWDAANALLRAEIAKTREDADRAIENIKLAMADERRQRQAQSELIIQLSEKVRAMQGVIEAQAATISGLRADLTESERKRAELKEALDHERGARLLLAAQLEVLQRR